jgi:hypothetical protein
MCMGRSTGLRIPALLSAVIGQSGVAPIDATVSGTDPTTRAGGRWLLSPFCQTPGHKCVALWTACGVAY